MSKTEQKNLLKNKPFSSIKAQNAFTRKWQKGVLPTRAC